MNNKKEKNFTVKIEYKENNEAWNNLVNNIISFIIENDTIGGMVDGK